MSFFKDFFKNIIHDRNPEEDNIKVKGKVTPVFYGTVAPYPNFSASKDAAVLQSAIESKGVDEDVIISVLVKRNNEQRQKIKAVFEASTGQSLNRALKRALRSDLEDICLALLMPPAHYDAYLIRDATKRLGTDEDVLVEVLATRSNEEIRQLKRVYKEEYGDELEDVIKDETKGDFTRALLAMLKANKDENTEVDMSQAQKDAETLFEAGENSKGIDVSAFIDILTTRSGPQLSKTFQRYACVSDMTLPKALNIELKGDIEDCLLDIGETILTAKKWMLSIEGRVIIPPAAHLADFTTALATLFACYYVFNLEYQASTCTTLEFIQRFLVRINPDSTKCSAKEQMSRKTGRVVKRKTSYMNPHVISFIRGFMEFNWLTD